MNWYNEIDPQKAAWLRELILRGIVAPGVVDERSITDVQPADLNGFTQCHFFAGIGVWSYALRRAGWPDSTPIWTGSCPCPSFSASGKGEGFSDPRHLWPAWFRLIPECSPDVIVGEQVASKAALAWLDVVSSDLEGAGYAIGAADLCAAGVGAPHIRQRIYFVADTERGRCEISHVPVRQPRQDEAATFQRGSLNGLANATSGDGVVGDTEGAGLQRERSEHGASVRDARGRFAGLPNNAWSDIDWLPCIDGKARPVESGTFPLAHGAPARVLRLRGYGDAIVAPLAQAFIEAYIEVRAVA